MISNPCLEETGLGQSACDPALSPSKRDWSFDQHSGLHAGPPEFWQAPMVLDFGIELASD